MSRRLLGLKALAFKPRSLVLQSPPYPIECDDAEDRYTSSARFLDIKLKPIPTIGGLFFKLDLEETRSEAYISDVDIRSIVLTVDQEVEPEIATSAVVLSDLELKSIIIEIDSMDIEEISSAVVFDSLVLTVVVVNTEAEETPITSNIEISGVELT